MNSNIFNPENMSPELHKDIIDEIHTAFGEIRNFFDSLEEKVSSPDLTESTKYIGVCYRILHSFQQQLEQNTTHE